jgi:hypothetical protein
LFEFARDTKHKYRNRNQRKPEYTLLLASYRATDEKKEEAGQLQLKYPNYQPKHNCCLFGRSISIRKYD